MMQQDTSDNATRDWLVEVIPRHERLSTAVASLITNMLKKQRLEYLSVEERTKSVEGALEKARYKEYSNPKEQLTDLSGVRVVTYLEEEALQISKAIRTLFNVDEANKRSYIRDPCR
jgi:putative GTP pyrophosphokinase